MRRWHCRWRCRRWCCEGLAGDIDGLRLRTAAGDSGAVLSHTQTVISMPGGAVRQAEHRCRELQAVL